MRPREQEAAVCRERGDTDCLLALIVSVDLPNTSRILDVLLNFFLVLGFCFGLVCALSMSEPR